MSDLPVLRRLHRLWLAFVIVVIGILVAIPLLDAAPSDLPLALTATLAVAGGVGAFIAVVAIDLTFAASPPADDVRALQEYEARRTLAFAVAQAPAVLGVALTFVFGHVAPAAIGGGFAAACLVRARPSVAGLERLEAAWARAGHDVSALRAARRGRDGTQPETRPAPDQGEGDVPDETPADDRSPEQRPPD